MSSTGPRRKFPMQIRLQGRTVMLRPIAAGDRDALLAFARALPQDDLLFLDRDITEPSEVERWLAAVAAGDLMTVAAWEDGTVVGYATYDRGNVRWTQHVAELRVVVAAAARGIRLGRLLLELVFEMAIDDGVTKVIARMTPDQTGARRLFQRLGFHQEAVLKEHARDGSGTLRDLLVLSLHTHPHQEQRCSECGTPVLAALALDGHTLCSHCFEFHYRELGTGG